MLGLGGVVRGATREMAKYWAELCGNVRSKIGRGVVSDAFQAA